MRELTQLNPRPSVLAQMRRFPTQLEAAAASDSQLNFLQCVPESRSVSESLEDLFKTWPAKRIRGARSVNPSREAPNGQLAHPNDRNAVPYHASAQGAVVSSGCVRTR